MSEKKNKNDLKDRVTYAVLRPATRLAFDANVSLRELKKLIEVAYYQEARKRGLKMREISAMLSISMAKVGLLSKALKEHFLQPEIEHGLSRQIVSLLWAGPLTYSQIVNALPLFQKESIDVALEHLIDEAMIQKIKGRTLRYELISGEYRQDINFWMAKLDGLNTLLEFVGRTIEARFFEDDSRANVRNVEFRMRKEDLGKIEDFYEKNVFPFIIELDEAVESESDSVPMKLSLLWTVDRQENNDEP